MDHLRKAKKGVTSEREYLELWKLLHDLVLVTLADFDVDPDEMRRMNAQDELEATLWDYEAQQLRIELVRFYLHRWGFACSSFYGLARSRELPQSADLLLAVAWLFAFSAFFERLHVPILERWIDASRASLVLPPYPNDVVLSPAQQTHAVATAMASADATGGSDAFEPLVQQLHAAVGRLQSHVNELQAYVRYHARLLAQLERRQRPSRDERVDVVPASVVQLLAQPRAALERHVQVLAQRLQMIDDEQLFYKWVNGLVATVARRSDDPDASDATPAMLATKFPALEAHVRSLEALVRDHKRVVEAVRANYTRAYRAFQQTARTSQQQTMALKMERLAADVAARELLDVHALFRPSRRPQAPVARSVGTETLKPLATEPDLASLRSQLTRVLDEIATAHCDAELQ